MRKIINDIANWLSSPRAYRLLTDLSSISFFVAFVLLFVLTTLAKELKYDFSNEWWYKGATNIVAVTLLASACITASILFNERLRKKNFTNLRHKKTTSNQQTGYIIYDMPNEVRSFFHDLLKGFEEYSKLKGYLIAFSIDNSIDNKIAFKFTILENKAKGNVSDEQVREDVKEYVNRVRNGGNLDGMPIIINVEEHHLIAATLKARIALIEYNYKLANIAKEFYEGMIDRIKNSNFGIQQQPAIYINSGGTQTQHQIQGSYIQGDHNRVGDESYNYLNIFNSFNKREAQIDKIVEIIKLVNKEKKVDKDIREEMQQGLQTIRKELEEYDMPNKQTIGRILSSLKKYGEIFVFSYDLQQAIWWLAKSLGMG